MSDEKRFASVNLRRLGKRPWTPEDESYTDREVGLCIGARHREEIEPHGKRG